MKQQKRSVVFNVEQENMGQDVGSLIARRIPQRLRELNKPLVQPAVERLKENATRSFRGWLNGIDLVHNVSDDHGCRLFNIGPEMDQCTKTHRDGKPPGKSS